MQIHHFDEVIIGADLDRTHFSDGVTKSMRCGLSAQRSTFDADTHLLAIVVPAFVFARHKIRRPPWMAVPGKTEPDLVGWEPEAIRVPVDATRPLRRAGSTP
jgi:hypothetical protein